MTLRKPTKWKPDDYLETDEDIAAYEEALCAEEGNECIKEDKFWEILEAERKRLIEQRDQNGR